MNSPQPASEPAVKEGPGNPWLWLLGGLVLGLVAGVAVPYSFPELPWLGQARSPAGASLQGGGNGAPVTRESARTQLGGGNATAGFAGRQAAITLRWQQAREAEYRAMTREGRLRAFAEFHKQLAQQMGRESPAARAELEFRMRTCLLAEDIPAHLEMLAAPGHGGMKPEVAALLRRFVTQKIAQDGLHGLAEPYRTSHPKFYEELARALKTEDARRNPFGTLQEAHAQLLETGNWYDSWQNLGRMAAQDPDRAFREILQLPSMNARQQGLQMVVQGLIARQGFEQAWAATEKIKEAGLRVQIQTQIFSLAENADPETRPQLLAFLEKEGLHEETRRQGLRQVISSWSQDDPAAALAWVESYQAGHPRDPVTTDLRRNALGSLAQRDPQAALPLIRGLPEEERSNYWHSWARGAAAQDLEGALRTAETLEGNDRLRVQANLVEHWAEYAPAEAADFVENAAPAEGGMVNSVMQKWVQDDPMAASAWLARLPQTEARDQGISTLIGHIREEDPEGAVLWAWQFSQHVDNRIEDEVMHWAGSDAAAARTWVHGNINALGGEQSRKLLERIQKETAKTSSSVNAPDVPLFR